MLALTFSLMSCIKWTPMLAILLDNKLALVALWILPLFLLRHPKMTRHLRMMMTPTMTMMMVRMEMLALLVLTRCLLDTFTLCHLWQKEGVVLVMRVVIVRGRVSIGDFWQRECLYEGCSEDLMYLFLFFLFQIHYILYMGLMTIIDIHCTYILYILMYVFLWPILTYVVYFLSLCTCFLYLHAIYYFCFTQRCLDEFCLKCFRNTGCQSLLARNSLLAKIFKSLC